MSKGYSSAMALIEAGKQMALGAHKEKPMRTERKKEDKPVDLMALLEQKRREYLAVKQFVEEQHKLAKPDEKKKEDGHWNVRNVALFLIATSPITGPLYVWWFRQLLGT